MKILVISNFYPPDSIGGYEIACCQMADALMRRGHEVKVLTSVPHQLVSHDEPHVNRILTLSKSYGSYFWMKQVAPVTRKLILAESNLINATNVHILIGCIRDWQPDVVYVSNIYGLGGMALMGCLQFLGIPWIWQLGDAIPTALCTLWNGFETGLAKEFERTLRGHFVVVSERLLRDIDSIGLRLRGHVELLPCWICGQRPPDRAAYYEGGHLRIVSAGAFTDDKGMDLIIEAAGMLREAGYDNFSVDLYGRTSDPSYEILIRERGLEDCVALKGFRPHAELMELFHNYDVFAFPTHEQESFGMAPLEALAHGCIPVMTRNCGISEWLVQDVHCLKTDRSSEAFSRVFRDIIDRKIDLEPLGRRGAAVAWNTFHVDVVAARIEQILERAARQSRAGGGTVEDAYLLASIAERTVQLLVQECK